MGWNFDFKPLWSVWLEVHGPFREFVYENIL